MFSTSVGTLEFRCVTEPVRNYSKDINFYQAFCDSIGKHRDYYVWIFVKPIKNCCHNLDLENQVIHCSSNVDDGMLHTRKKYDMTPY